MSVSDGSLSSAAAGASVTFTNVDDAPELVTNALTLAEGETVTLDAANLSATDAEATTGAQSGALVFTVSAISGGQFEEAGAPGTPITSFTQQQLTDGQIRFVHDGGEAAPAYEVSVSDGSLSSAAAGASVTFTNVDDAPELVTNALTLEEGETVTLDAADLSATDAEATTGTEIGALVFTVSAVSGGQFEEASAAGTPITSFTQQQLLDGQIRFVHDGGEAAPAYSVTVSDGAASDGPEAATIVFTNVNDAPVAVADAGTLAEGGTLVLDLAGNDTDADDGLDLASIVIVTAPSHGTVTVNANGTVEYTHDGSESTADGFTYTIEDASGAVSNVAGVTLTVTAVNDAPALVNNALTLEEGETVTLDAADLSATDAEATTGVQSGALIFTVSVVSGGQFEEVGAPGTAITSFTQQQLTDSEIRFVHDGGEAAPAYEVSVSDGVLSDGPAGASVTFTNVDDAPELVTNALTLAEGETVTLDGTNLSATDIDTADNTLVFTVSGISGGQFEEVSGAGTPITSFTQQQLTDSEIRFVHDGGEAAPAYEVSVSDGGLSSASAGASITFTNVDDAPALVTNALTLAEGETVTLVAADLSATDAETADSALIFTVSNLSGGRFEEASAAGTPITSFTQQQLLDSEIRFVHDGGEAAPAYEVSVSDGVLNTAAAGASVTFTNVNDAPALVTNALTLAEGETVTLDAADLSATDAEATTGTEIGALVFTVSAVSGGQFEEASAAGTPITSFTQQQVSDGQIRFVHDGGRGGAGVRGERERRGAERWSDGGERDVRERQRRPGGGGGRRYARGGGHAGAGSRRQ